MSEKGRTGRQGSSAVMELMEREISIVRVFDAPREMVFKAWTDPVRLKQWWGPKVFTNTVCEADVRPGDKFYIVMSGPNGMEFPCSGEYREVTPPSRLVFTNNALDRNGKQLLEGLTTVEFEALGEKTRIRLHSRAAGEASVVSQMLAGMEAGWTETVDKLERNVNMRPAEAELVNRRIFDAPRDLVFRAWRDPEQIVQWWGPRGFTTTSISMDFRPGGAWKHVMHGPDGRDYGNRIVYEEIAAPERIAYRMEPEEGDEQVRFHSIVTFESQGDRTLVTMRICFASDAEREEIVNRYRADIGQIDTFERLAEHLARLR